MASKVLALVVVAAVLGVARGQITCPDVSAAEARALATQCAGASDVCGPECAGAIFEFLILDKLGGAVPCQFLASTPDAASQIAQQCQSPFVGPFLQAGVDVRSLQNCAPDTAATLGPVVDRLTCTDTDKDAATALAPLLGGNSAGVGSEESVEAAEEPLPTEEPVTGDASAAVATGEKTGCTGDGPCAAGGADGGGGSGGGGFFKHKWGRKFRGGGGWGVNKAGAGR